MTTTTLRALTTSLKAAIQADFPDAQGLTVPNVAKLLSLAGHEIPFPAGGKTIAGETPVDLHDGQLIELTELLSAFMQKGVNDVGVICQTIESFQEEHQGTDHSQTVFDLDPTSIFQGLIENLGEQSLQELDAIAKLTAAQAPVYLRSRYLHHLGQVLQGETLLPLEQQSMIDRHVQGSTAQGHQAIADGFFGPNGRFGRLAPVTEAAPDPLTDVLQFVERPLTTGALLPHAHQVLERLLPSGDDGSGDTETK